MRASRREASRPRVGVSRCLLGDEVRYDGGHKRQPLLLENLGPHVEWLPVCPEVEIGMGTPREPIALVSSADGLRSGDHRVRLSGVRSGTDWTAAMDAYRRARIAELKLAGIAGFVLKQGSPSCGVGGVPVRSGDGEVAAGRGLFAQALLEQLPGLPIEEESALADREVRDSFLARVRTYHQQRCLRMRR